MPPQSCPSCGKDAGEDSRFCSHCGTTIATIVFGNDESREQPVERNSRSSSASTRFIPGELVGDRYRIVALLGRGGMGEVYRADDLKLDQAVALKFLPEGVERDPRRLKRFLAEVRLARQIGHPNICRVYDIGQVGEQHFISMEFIDGEDLSSLLRRIGRLPAEKALEIARQLCGGLAAAHDKGILHRDLKPANVMLDELGVARITDFGLAAAAESIPGRAAQEGTPAYMAPEQMEGAEVTRRSDIYALGLVLYELFAGQKAFQASSVLDLLRMKQETSPASLSSSIDGIDPLVERAILSCLDPDPKRRPSSARQVMAMLPGGDPLEAALAAGETPSPEAVAASAKEGSLTTGVAVAVLLGIIVLVAAALLLHDRTKLYRQVALPNSPEQLTLRARQVLTSGGIEPYAAGNGAGLEYDGSVFRMLFTGDDLTRLRDDLDSGRVTPLLFWYRSSPAPIVPEGMQIQSDRPPLSRPGELAVHLDPGGRLRRVVVLPGTEQRTAGARIDWARLFSEAGLDPSRFEQIPPRWTPPSYADEVSAWRETGANAGLEVTAASLGGRLVWFEVLSLGVPPQHLAFAPPGGGERLFWWLLVSFYLTVVLVALVLAGRNLRLGRGDRVAALRLAISLVAARTLRWVFGGSHVQSVDEALVAIDNIGFALVIGVVAWAGYIALEPIVRRQWPHRIISWTRLIHGDWRDPLVGRDILFGVLLGLLMANIATVRQLLVFVSRGLDFGIGFGFLGPFHGIGGLVAELCYTYLASMVIGLSAMIFIVLLFLVLRRHLLAALAFWALFSVVLSLILEVTPVQIALGIAAAGVFTIAAARFGLLTVVTTHAVLFFAHHYPTLPSFDAWYLPSSLAALVAILALAVFGFLTSRGTRSLFGEFRLVPD
ncbi:MAG TPA: serine/threonine-protein kinase [Thermoanaerobaculia bacterium]|nr:serine/threonine-protein kinase [Thermoanaerobaculia bacterium]